MSQNTKNHVIAFLTYQLTYVMGIASGVAITILYTWR